MNKEASIAMIKRVSDAYGASGFEYDAVNVLREYTKGYGRQEEDHTTTCMWRCPVRAPASR